MNYADNYCTYTENIETYTFTGNCVITGKEYSVSVPKAGLYAYRQGALIQDAFPGVCADDREFLMSGISPEGWKQAFPVNLASELLEMGFVEFQAAKFRKVIDLESGDFIVVETGRTDGKFNCGLYKKSGDDFSGFLLGFAGTHGATAKEVLDFIDEVRDYYPSSPVPQS